MSPTVESRALLDKGRENLRAAALLRREGFLDIAASRAYYAMFYAAEALLLARARPFPATQRSLPRLGGNSPSRSCWMCGCTAI